MAHFRAEDICIGRSLETQANQKRERQYYENIISSNLRRDSVSRLRSSANQQQLVNDELKPVGKLDDDRYGQRQHDVLNYEQFGNGDRLYARSGDHSRSRNRKAGALRYWRQGASARAGRQSPRRY